MASPRTADLRMVNNAINEIDAAVTQGDAALALKVLARLVPEFAHNAEGGETGLAVSAAAR